MKSEFLSPRDPDTFWKDADDRRRKLGAERFFNKAGMSWLREAWTIGRFGILVGAQSVSLIDSDPPDAALVKDGHTFQFEIVEALKPERRRGKEYRKPRTEPAFVDEADLAIDEKDICSWIDNAIKQKLQKRQAVGGNWNVLVHVGGLYLFADNRKLNRIVKPPINGYTNSANLIVCILRGRAAFGPPMIVPANGFIEVGGD